MKTTKTLKEIIDMYDHIGEKLEIQYRTYASTGYDVFTGVCFYNYQTKELIPSDYDEYDLDDEFIKWEMTTDIFSGKQFLQVWFDGNWV